MADLHEWDTTYRGEYEKSIQSLNEGWWYKESKWGESTSPDDILCDILVDMAENMPLLAESMPLCDSPVESTEEAVLELFDEMLNDMEGGCTSSLDQSLEIAGQSVAEITTIPSTNNHSNDNDPSEHPYPPPNNDSLYVTEEKVEGGGSNHSSGELGSGRSSTRLIGECLGLVTAVSMDDSELNGMPPPSTTNTAQYARRYHQHLLRSATPTNLYHAPLPKTIIYMLQHQIRKHFRVVKLLMVQTT